MREDDVWNDIKKVPLPNTTETIKQTTDSLPEKINLERIMIGLIFAEKHSKEESTLKEKWQKIFRIAIIFEVFAYLLTICYGIYRLLNPYPGRDGLTGIFMIFLVSSLLCQSFLHIVKLRESYNETKSNKR